MSTYGGGPDQWGVPSGQPLPAAPPSVQWASPTTPWPAHQPAPRAPSGDGRPRTWLRWALPAGALALGLVLGGITVAGLSDPTQTDEYQALAVDLGAAEDRISASEQEVRDAQAAAGEAEAAAAQRNAELDQREQAVAAKEQTVVAREQAVTAIEQTIAANSVGEGTWTVGRDIAPGTYRTAEAVTGQCYWGIYRSGTNGSDIIDNDIVTGGFPTVRLSEGQDFTNNDCGTFVKQ